MSEHRRVWTTKHLASIMMLGVVVSIGEKMPLIWYERGYSLTSAFYKNVLETRVLSWVKISKKSNYVFRHDGSPVYAQQRLRTTGWTQTWALSSKIFGSHRHWIWNLSKSACRCTLKKACKTRHSNTNELKASVNRAWSRKKGFAKKVCKSFRPRLERTCYCLQRWPHWLIWYFWVLIYHYITKVV